MSPGHKIESIFIPSLFITTVDFNVEVELSEYVKLASTVATVPGVALATVTLVGANVEQVIGLKPC